ncbi:HU family DNA-binding protein, partial [Erwinia amylovora]|uniref:HU family DNA-binding protein n=1 Tax=Erwinia amylovora TaxID=552 RepID=UPI00200A34C1
MNKTQLSDKIAAEDDICKAAAGLVVDDFIGKLTESLQPGDEVALVGFGTFSLRERDERDGSNPHTGKEITIEAGKVT